MSKLSSYIYVYRCGLFLSKLVSEPWRQLKSYINSTERKYLAANTAYFIAFGPHLCWRHTGHWAAHESVNTLLALLFVILFLCVSVRQVPFCFFLLQWPLHYLLHWNTSREQWSVMAVLGNFKLILMKEALSFQAARLLSFSFLWILSPWFEKSRHLYTALMDCNLQVCSLCYNFLKLSNKLLR